MAADATRAAVATALGVLAVIAVLTTATTAGLSYTGGSAEEADGPDRGGAPQPSPAQSSETSEAPTFFTDGQSVTGDRSINANLEVPANTDGWAVTDGFSTGFEGRVVTARIGAGVPAGVLQTERCPAAYGGQPPPAVVGYWPIPEELEEQPDDPQGAIETTVEIWLDAAVPPDADRPEPAYEDLTLSDGTPAVATSVEVPASRPGPCAASRELRFVSFDSDETLVNVVLSRSLDEDGAPVPGGLPADVADQILLSLRKQQP